MRAVIAILFYATRYWRVRAGRRFAVVAAMCLAGASARAGEDTLQRRAYQVRIAVARSESEVKLKADGFYHVLDAGGEIVHRMQPGEVYRVQLVQRREARNLHRLVIREFAPQQQGSAVQMAHAAADAYGLKAKVIQYPPGADATRQKGIMVAVGEFVSAEDARRYAQRTGMKSVKRIYEEFAPEQKQRVVLLDAEGRVVVSDRALLRIVALDSREGSIHVKGRNGAPEDRDIPIDKARHYRGNLEIGVDANGLITVVNDVWLEHYLYGVVPAEIGGFAPAEALKAQAVVARSVIVAKIERDYGSPSYFYDLADTPLGQVYIGREQETPEVIAAVDATRGEALVWNGRVIDAVYSHSCGGVISSVTDMWGSSGHDYSASKFDNIEGKPLPNLTRQPNVKEILANPPATFCNPDWKGFPAYAKKHFRWRRVYTADDLRALFDRAYATGAIRNVVVEERSPSGRVQALRVEGEQKTLRFDREMEIRRALGGLKSTFFVVAPERTMTGRLQRLTLHGGGFGHGAGMCQMGAFVMANWYNYRQILGHYFTDVKIRRLYAEP